MAGNVGGVGGDLVGDDPLPHVVQIGQAQVLLGGHVAEHSRPVPGCHSGADGAGDVVVARRHVGHHRPQHVERGLVATFHLQLDVALDLVHGDVARPFDHHLAIVLAGTARQRAHHMKLGELGRVAGVGQRTGPQPVAQTPGHVVLPHEVAQFVEMRVEGILLAVDHHPLGHQGPAAADDARHAPLGERQMRAQQSGMDGHVIDALPGLLLDHVEKVLRPHVGDVVQLLGQLIDGHRADRHRGGVDDPLPHGVDFLAGGEIHHGVGPVADRQRELFQFALRVAGDRRLADVGVDLRPGGDADADRLQVLAQMDHVGRNDHPPAGHFVPDQFRRELLAGGDRFHLGRDDARPSLLNLSHATSPHRPPCPWPPIPRRAR